MSLTGLSALLLCWGKSSKLQDTPSSCIYPRRVMGSRLRLVSERQFSTIHTPQAWQLQHSSHDGHVIAHGTTLQLPLVADLP